MPTLQSGDRIYRVSFSDVFKSSKTLREEQLAHAALRVSLPELFWLIRLVTGLYPVR